MEGVANFKCRSRDPNHPHFRGQFVMHWLVRVILNVRTKYEVCIFNCSELRKRIAKFKNVSRHQSHAPVEVNFLSADKGFHVTCNCTKFEAHIFIHSKAMEGSHILNLGHVTLTMPTFGGHFVVRWIVHVLPDVCTKYEVSLFNLSKDIKVSQNF